ncbi:DUF488 domain-containing protein [Spirochaetota bacterium]
MAVYLKRVYEAPAKGDGRRILVDRLWPRGISKEKAELFLWLKEVAPTPELRKWFNHEPEKWQEFRKRYKKELETSKAFLELKKLAKDGDISLIYAARDTEHNEALVLKELLVI